MTPPLLYTPKGVFNKIGDRFNEEKIMCNKNKLKRNERLTVAEEVVEWTVLTKEDCGHPSMIQGIM